MAEGEALQRPFAQCGRRLPAWRVREGRKSLPWSAGQAPKRSKGRVGDGPESPRPRQRMLQGRHGATSALSLASRGADSDRATNKRTAPAQSAEIRQNHRYVSQALDRLGINA
jgi:hypothetical protein